MPFRPAYNVNAFRPSLLTERRMDVSVARHYYTRLRWISFRMCMDARVHGPEAHQLLVPARQVFLDRLRRLACTHTIDELPVGWQRLIDFPTKTAIWYHLSEARNQ